MVTSDSSTKWSADGFIVREGLAASPVCDAVLAATRSAVIRLGREEFAQGSTLPTEMLARYQLSAHGMMVFWDPDLADPATVAPDERAGLYARLGHCIHRVDPHLADPHLADFVTRGPLAHVAAELNGGPVEPVQSLVMAKQPGSRVRFEYHHDGAYIRTEPDSLVVAWLALDDTDASNGGLRLVPGSHRQSHDPTGPPAPMSAGVSLPLPRGAAAFWRGGMLHASDLNQTARPRRGLIAYYVAAGADVEVEPCRPR